MKRKKYDRINKPLSIVFTKLLMDFIEKADNAQEEKLMILMAQEIWNISYFDHSAQQHEIENFINSLHVDLITQRRYKILMMQGVQEKNSKTRTIDVPNVWTKVEKLNIKKAAGKYKVAFEFDYYE